MGALTSSERSLPGTAGTPVMKSEVMKVRMTTERWKGECRGRASGWWPKSMGMSTTGIWLTQDPASAGGGRGSEVETVLPGGPTVLIESAVRTVVHLPQGGQDGASEQGGSHCNHWARDSAAKHPHHTAAQSKVERVERPQPNTQSIYSCTDVSTVYTVSHRFTLWQSRGMSFASAKISGQLSSMSLEDKAAT